MMPLLTPLFKAADRTWRNLRNPEDTPFPIQLTLGWVGQRPVPVVWATATGTGRTVTITVYEPNPEEWDNAFRQRRT